MTRLLPRSHLAAERGLIFRTSLEKQAFQQARAACRLEGLLLLQTVFLRKFGQFNR